MAKEVFVSYSSDDKVIADKLCVALEDLGLDCWIAPRDIRPGAEFDVAILDGIDQCQAMVVILTPKANISVFVRNEVNRAFSRGKAILTFRLEDIKPAKALEFYLLRHQWTDGFPPPVEEHIARIGRALLELVGRPHRMPDGPSKELQSDNNRVHEPRESAETQETQEGFRRFIGRSVSIESRYLGRGFYGRLISVADQDDKELLCIRSDKGEEYFVSSELIDQFIAR